MQRLALTGRIVMLALVFLLAACAAEDTGSTPCTSSVECDTGEICLDGTCRTAQSCTLDSECEIGMYCRNGYCSPTSTCATVDDCAPGFDCLNGYCYPSSNPNGCRTSMDCEIGQICNTVTGQCVNNIPGDQDLPETDGDESIHCTSTTDCPDGSYCDFSTSTCKPWNPDGDTTETDDTPDGDTTETDNAPDGDTDGDVEIPMGNLCEPCGNDTDCNANMQDWCMEDLTGETYCARFCDENAPCPEGFRCRDIYSGTGTVITTQCLPDSGYCVEPDGDVAGGKGLCEACSTDAECGGTFDKCIPDGSGNTFCGTDCAHDQSCAVTGTYCKRITPEVKQCFPISNICDGGMADGDETPDGDSSTNFCYGYTGSDACCATDNPCNKSNNGVCDCDGVCSWDSVDCSGGTTCTWDSDCPSGHICDFLSNRCVYILCSPCTIYYDCGTGLSVDCIGGGCATSCDMFTSCPIGFECDDMLMGYCVPTSGSCFEEDGDTGPEYCPGHDGETCCMPGDPCNQADNSTCECAGCDWDTADCATPEYCTGNEGVYCCQESNPCGKQDNSVCDCDGCSWDTADCAGPNYCPGHEGEHCCEMGDPCDWGNNGVCTCEGCAWEDSDCNEELCEGYTGYSSCCKPSNPCGWDGNGACDCAMACAWDNVDCGITDGDESTDGDETDGDETDGDEATDGDAPSECSGACDESTYDLTCVGSDLCVCENGQKHVESCLAVCRDAGYLETTQCAASSSAGHDVCYCSGENTFCSGYTGTDTCCTPANSCNQSGNSACNCDGTCGWDAADCGQTAGTCQAPIPVPSIPFTYNGNTGPMDNLLGLTGCSAVDGGSLSTASGPEQVFEFRAGNSTPLTFTVDSNFDAVITVRGPCSNSPSLCLGDDSYYSTDESVTFNFTDSPPSVWYVVVDGVDSDEWGSYTLTITNAAR